jgi:hypothetical protein
MAVLTVSPNPSQPGQTVTATGSGYMNRSTRLRLQGSVVVDSFMPGIDGAFTRQITVPASAGNYALEVQQKIRGWRTVTTTQITVQAVTPPPPPPPPDPGPTGLVIGTIAIDTKANLRLGPDGKVSHRFRSRGGIPKAYRFSQRGGPVYSAGTGGTTLLAIHEDSGGKPGARIASVSRAFGNPINSGWTTYLDTLISGPALVAGRVYHVVHENTDSAPLSNYISVNDCYAWRIPIPQNPLDPDMEVLTFRNGAWAIEADGGYVPVFDLTYEDAAHDGQGYIEAFVQFYGPIGGQYKVRQTFQAEGTYSELGVRVRRTNGVDPLTITLAGHIYTVPASAFPLARPSVHSDTSTYVGAVWAVVPLGGLALSGAQEIRLSAPATSAYGVTPIREGTVEGMRSARVTGGALNYSSDGGATWRPPYSSAESDLQFYLR